jgi:hypothetical protein
MPGTKKRRGDGTLMTLSIHAAFSLNAYRIAGDFLFMSLAIRKVIRMVKTETCEPLQQKFVTKNLVSQQNPTDAIQTLSCDAVYGALNSYPQGLSQAETEARLRAVGSNAIQEAKGQPLY